MNPDVPLVPKQISIPFTMKKQLKWASLLSRNPESETMRNTLITRDEENGDSIA